MTDNYYPKPDRSDFMPRGLSLLDDSSDVIDVGWNEGFFSDSRPYRAEYWCQDQVSVLTFFMSTRGLENASKEEFVDLLTREKVVEFLSNKRYVGLGKLIDPSGSELWSINVVIGDDEETFAQETIPLIPYRRPI